VSDNRFRVTKALVRKVLSDALVLDVATQRGWWTLQGFGMLRFYLGDFARIHVWDASHMVADASVIHNHFWDLRSTVVSGRMTNQRYRVMAPNIATPATHWSQQLRTGEGGGLLDEPERVVLCPQVAEVYNPGDSYSQGRHEVHESLPSRGCVTVMERDEDKEKVKTAFTFWPIEGKWVSAEPREATFVEVRRMCATALREWG
jgi:hypothetical protein